MTASAKYLERYAEAEAAFLMGATVARRWLQVLVVPAYRESPHFLENLRRFSQVLLILVLNRPATEPDDSCNDGLRSAVLNRGATARWPNANATLVDFDNGNHVLLLERSGPLPAAEGVGLARKLGCDVALALQQSARIESQWIHCSDADAVLPEDYFTTTAQHRGAVALTYPFAHDQPSDPPQRAAMECYDEFLRHYVYGLATAGSPYAFFTLGSCLAVKGEAYGKVRGFPKRAGGEDFYLLNKLAKLGVIATPNSNPICLSARVSRRVPFGTGPALRKLLDQEQGADVIFYHPDSFEALRLFLEFVEERGRPGLGEQEFAQGLGEHEELLKTLTAIGLPDFLSHAAKHCADPSAFKKQFHQWFDGFRTLKLMRALSQCQGRLTLDEYRRACRVN